MKKIFLFLTALIIVVAFYSCSKDDNNNTMPIKEAIIGTWQIAREGGSEVYNDGTSTGFIIDYPISNIQVSGYYWSYTFNNDGTCIWRTFADDRNPKVDDRFTYSISGNNLIVKHKDDNKLDFVCEIKNNTVNQLVLFYQQKTDTCLYNLTQVYKKER